MCVRARFIVLVFVLQLFSDISSGFWRERERENKPSRTEIVYLKHNERPFDA